MSAIHFPASQLEASKHLSADVAPLLFFLGLYKINNISSLNMIKDTSYLISFLCRDVLIMNSIILIDMRVFIYFLFLLESVLTSCFFQEICAFHFILIIAYGGIKLFMR